MNRLNQFFPKKNKFTAEDVFCKTDRGYDVFKSEIEGFKINRNIKNPFVSKDNNPSARIKKSLSSNLWILSVYNDEGGCYNAITFIQKKYNLTYNESIIYIMKNQNLSPSPPKINTLLSIKSSISYEVNYIPFTKEHTRYYTIGSINEKFLNTRMDIYAIDKYAINKNVKEIPPSAICFAYIFRDSNNSIVNGKVKLLHIGENITKQDKWRTSIEPYKFFYTYKINESTKRVFVVKSNKDAAIFEYYNITAIATMSENKHNIKIGLLDLMKEHPNIEFILCLGSDFQGCEQTSIPLSKELNLRWFNTPKYLLKNDINDPFSYVKKFGLVSFKNLLKRKKYI